MTKIILLLSLGFLGSHCLAERKLLMLQKKNSNKNAYYSVGDKISFRIIGGHRKISGEIIDLRDSVVVFRGFEIPVKQISSIYIDEKTKWWLRFKIEQLSLRIGAGYLALDFINSGKLDNNSLIIGGSLIGVGLIVKILIGNRIKIRGKTRLKILAL